MKPYLRKFPIIYVGKDLEAPPRPVSRSSRLNGTCPAAQELSPSLHPLRQSWSLALHPATLC